MLFQGFQYDKLNRLMNELDDHYEFQLMELLQQDPNVRTPASFSVGDPVASVWETDNLWYRGVVRGNKMGKWEVFNVDYGDTHLVGEPFIMPLDRNFCVFPAQAIRAKLAGENFSLLFYLTICDQELSRDLTRRPPVSGPTLPPSG